MKTSIRILCWAVLATGLLCTNLPASPIFGTFNIGGTVTVTNDTISWVSNDSPFPADKATIGPGATGSFAALGGTTVTIHDLDRTIEPVGTGFADHLFITFDADPSLQGLELNFIFDGIYSSAGCLASPPAVGQQCTPGPPITPADSPFNFVNNKPDPPLGPQATATWVFMGDSSNHDSVWTGNFTSQFGVPFQTILEAFGPGGSGSVTNTYSATIVAVAPEPGALITVGLGLGLVALSRLRRIKR